MPAEVVPFTTIFGDSLDVARHEDGRLFVSVRRICEHLGVTFSTQRTKLNKASWAQGGVFIMNTPDARGHAQDAMMLAIDCLPMWMATIQVGRVSEHLRSKLEWYQNQAKDVLAAAFLPQDVRTEPRDKDVTPVWRREILARLDDLGHSLTQAMGLSREANDWSRQARDMASGALARAGTAEAKVATLEAEVTQLKEALRDTIRSWQDQVQAAEFGSKKRPFRKPFTITTAIDWLFGRGYSQEGGVA
jgi:hypothetical protein